MKSFAHRHQRYNGHGIVVSFCVEHEIFSSLKLKTDLDNEYIPLEPDVDTFVTIPFLHCANEDCETKIVSTSSSGYLFEKYRIKNSHK